MEGPPVSTEAPIGIADLSPAFSVSRHVKYSVRVVCGMWNTICSTPLASVFFSVTVTMWT